MHDSSADLCTPINTYHSILYVSYRFEAKASAAIDIIIILYLTCIQGGCLCGTYKYKLLTCNWALYNIIVPLETYTINMYTWGGSSEYYVTRCKLLSRAQSLYIYMS